MREHWMSDLSRSRMRKPMHPGAILKNDILPALGLSVSKTAERLGISRQFLHKILAEQSPVTAAMALRIGKFCGNGPELWLNMQQAYDLWEARQALGREIAKIKTAEAA
jgi:addiction module HigA family antidote